MQYITKQEEMMWYKLQEIAKWDEAVWHIYDYMIWYNTIMQDDAMQRQYGILLHHLDGMICAVIIQHDMMQYKVMWCNSTQCNIWYSTIQYKIRQHDTKQ